MSDWRESYEEAQRTAHGTHARMRALQIALDHAEAMNEVDGAFEIRLDIVETAYYSGDPIPALSAFAWCLARWDAEPERFDEHSYTLGWRHKWMPVWAMEFPAVAAPRLEAMVEDLERRHVADGAGRRQALGVRLQLALDTGLGGPLDELLGDWRASARSSLSDCGACENLIEARCLVALGRRDEALAVIQPLLTGSAYFCADGPEYVLALAVPLLIDAGLPADAANAFRRGIRNSREDARKQVPVATLLASAARAGEQKRIAPLVASTIGLLDDAPSPLNRMEASAAFARALRALDPDEAVLTPSTVPAVLVADGPDPDTLTTAGALADVLAGQARSLAVAFDERNGNEVASTDIESVLAAPDLDTVGLFRIDATRPEAPADRSAEVPPSAPTTDATGTTEPPAPEVPLPPEEAVERSRALLAEAEAQDDPVAPDTLALVREAIQAVRDHGTTEALADARRAMGRLLALAGRLDEAAVQLAEAADLYDELDDPLAAAGVLLDRAQVELALDESDRAADLAGDALMAIGAADPAAIEDLGVRRRALAVRADLATRNWDTADAIRHLRQLIDLDEAAGEDTVDARIRLARLFGRVDDTDAALAELDRADADVASDAQADPARRAEIAVRRIEALWEGDRNRAALDAAEAADSSVRAAGRPDLVVDLLVAVGGVTWALWVDTWGPDDQGIWDDESGESVGEVPFLERGDPVLRDAALARNQVVLDELDALEGATVEPWHRNTIEWRLTRGEDGDDA